jgi:hypothetical protein
MTGRGGEGKGMGREREREREDLTHTASGADILTGCLVICSERWSRRFCGVEVEVEEEEGEVIR